MNQTDRPAVAGGTPIRATPLPYGRHTISKDDIATVTAILRSDWLTTGPTIELFERALAQQIGAAHVVAVSSGTAALHAACAAADIGPGDEVIVPSLTFVATANAVVYRGATPVFADIDGETLMLDPIAARRAVTERTQAIIVVHYAGAPADVAALRALGPTVIEDAAHALGAIGPDGPVGSRSRLAAFSFHPVKLLTTGEGGAIATDSAEMAAVMRRFRNHGLSSDAREREHAGSWQYAMTSLGFNYRLTDIGAALGLSQLGRVDVLLRRRRDIALRYLRLFDDAPFLRVPRSDPERSAWHFFPILLEPSALRISRDEFIRALRADRIGANVHYAPVHLQPFYRQRFGTAEGQLRVSEDVAARLVTLPLFPAMTDRDVDDVVTATCRIASWFAA